MLTRLNKSELAAKIGVSERALSEWQKRGMPVLWRGRRGQKNTYDLAAVVQWMRFTGAGSGLIHRRPPVDLAALELEIYGRAGNPEIVPQSAQIALARAVALARLDYIKDGHDREFGLSIANVAEIGDLLIGCIARRLAHGAFVPASRVLVATMSDAPYPAAFDEIVARFSAEVPPAIDG